MKAHEFVGLSRECDFKAIRIRGYPILKEWASPNPSAKNFLSMLVGDGELLRSKQPTHILKVLGDGGPGHRR